MAEAASGDRLNGGHFCLFIINEGVFVSFTVIDHTSGHNHIRMVGKNQMK